MEKPITPLNQKETPGTGNKTFTIKLDKDHFCNSDIINSLKEIKIDYEDGTSTNLWIDYKEWEVLQKWYGGR